MVVQFTHLTVWLILLRQINCAVCDQWFLGASDGMSMKCRGGGYRGKSVSNRRLYISRSCCSTQRHFATIARPRNIPWRQGSSSTSTADVTGLCRSRGLTYQRTRINLYSPRNSSDTKNKHEYQQNESSVIWLEIKKTHEKNITFVSSGYRSEAVFLRQSSV